MAKPKNPNAIMYGGRPRPIVKGPHPAKLKHSHFLAVKYYMEGKTKKEALIKAGYSRDSVHVAIGMVFSRQDVLAEIDRQREKMLGRSKGIVDRIKDELAKVAFFNLGDVLEVTKEGELVFNFEEATMDDMAALGEVTVETRMEGRGKDRTPVRKIKVKPLSKLEALGTLCRIHNMLNDTAVTVNVNGQSLEERLQAGRKRVGAPVVDAEFTEVEEEDDVT